jgi:RNA polymerase sigma factor (sigma-70 family)
MDEVSYRSPPRPSIQSDEDLENVGGSPSPDDSLLIAEAADEAQNLLALLLRAMEDLGDEDRMILRMRFWGGASVADTARALGIPQKPLYRRLDRLLQRLRDALVRDGVSADDVRALLEEVDR